MHFRSIGFLLLLSAGCTGSTPVAEIAAPSANALNETPGVGVAAGDWPFWRGSTKDGHASGDPVPVEWSEYQNIVWKSPIPGRGHSSPTVVGDRIFLTTADEAAEVQSVLCLDGATGEIEWQTEAHRGSFPKRGMHSESTHASSTVACNGERLFAVFLNGGSIWTTALDLEGNQLWQTEVGPFEPQFGYGASPALYKSLVIVAADHSGGAYLAALNGDTGDIYWRKSRGSCSSYSSPIVAAIDGKDQLLLSGDKRVVGYDPATGEELWSCSGTAETTCGTAVFDGEFVFASGGYPQSETLCVLADGSGEVAWRIKDKSYVPSMLLHEKHLYAVESEGGILFCCDAQSGERKWRMRLQPKFRASPVVAGDNIYLCNTRGTIFVYKADPNEYQSVAANQLGDEIYATPTICGGRIYIRAADSSAGKRQETLYCIGQPSAE